MDNNICYFDQNGKPIYNHDGTIIKLPNNEMLFFDINGKGFIHDGSMIKMPNGQMQFFLHDGKAIIHDGSPIELSTGLIQYFDHNGVAFFPIDERKLIPLYAQQRDIFFENRINHIKKQTPLDKNQIEELRLALLAAEHPDYLEKNIKAANIQEGKKIKLDPICEDTNGYLILLKGFWHTIWNDFQLRHKEILSARHTLEKYKQEKCQFASNSLSESLLVDELKREFKIIDKVIELDKNNHKISDIDYYNQNKMYILDSIFIEYCKNHTSGEGTQQFLEQSKNAYANKTFDIKQRIESWRHPLFMYRCLASIIWFNKIKKRIENLQKKPPALTYIVNEQIQKPMRNGTKYIPDVGKILDYKGQELAVIDMKESSKILPSMNIEIIQKILRPENIKVLSSVNAHRLLRWEIQTVTKQFVDGMVDARALKVYGGYQELATMLGIGNNRRAAEQLRDIIVWQAAPRFYQPNGRYGNMLSFDYTPSGHGRKAVLQLIMGNMMLPHYVYEILNMPEISMGDRRLIPIVDMPPLIGRSNDQGAQPSFQIEILVEMRKAAKEFATNGCVLIRQTKLEELAEKAGLSKRIYVKVIDRWLQDGTDAPAFLKIMEEDRYALGSHYKQAQDFIIQAGQKELNSSKAGKKGVARRNAGIYSTK